MKISILFRSKEQSNDICSATKHQLLKSQVDKFIDLEFVNLDKKNLQKYLLIEPRPNVVYIWHDEEIYMDFIKDNYPEIEIKTYSREEREKHSGYWGNQYKYVLADQIINECKDATGFIEYYEVSVLTGAIKKAKMTNFDYEKNSNKTLHFSTEEEAKEFLKKKLAENIEDAKMSIESYKERIKKYEKILKKLNK